MNNGKERQEAEELVEHIQYTLEDYDDLAFEVSDPPERNGNTYVIKVQAYDSPLKATVTIKFGEE